VAAAAKSTGYWAQAMTADGFFIECVRFNEEETFNIIAKEPTRFDGLRRIASDAWPSKSSSPVKDYWIIWRLTEPDLRSKLAGSNFSTAEIEQKIESARRWVTTVTRRP
jgi:hypothetical protein